MKSVAIFLCAAFAIMQADLLWGQFSYSPPPTKILNEGVDISGDFRDFANTYYLASKLSEFDPVTAQGKLEYKRYEYSTRQAFNNMLAGLKAVPANEFPSNEYAVSPNLPFALEFISPRTVRIRANSENSPLSSEESLMLVNGKAPVDNTWKYTKLPNGHLYKSAHGSVVIRNEPWKLEFYNASGQLITSTNSLPDNDSTYTPVMPFSYVRRASDYSRSYHAVFNLAPTEKIFGCGESFTKLDKRGQKIVLFTDDANGVENESMYKPIPFFMSSKGFGVFMHTSTPITCDFGKYYSGTASLMIGDSELDLFVFIGNPKEILNAYTDLTGKAEMPPLWSFGFWQSRITYFSEKEGRAVADKLRVNKIPADVIHFDTGWFETDWRCDYQFSPSRFEDAGKMIHDLKKQGFQVCLWQLPYFVPQNSLFSEIVSKNLYVKGPDGKLPYEDAVLDFSNPATVAWYQEKIAGLLKQGVGVIKVDFGEAAPLNGIYHSGKTGFYEHNLYPLRYNKTVADVTKRVNSENIIWARSAWAGSQRYPLHWGGDAAATNIGMAGDLRGGISLGLSGFSFWSHDVGGFTRSTPEDLYRRWTAFGIFSSHTRSHGLPPKEAWEYSPDFLNYFRTAIETRYRLMPYIYAQAQESAKNGLPMVRALFIEFPNDPGAWLMEDEYMFGSDFLIAPMLESGKGRNVYLPEGNWIDYQSGKYYSGGWHYMETGKIDAAILVRSGKAIPHIALAQSTAQMDWSKIEWVVFGKNENLAEGILCLPSDNKLYPIQLKKQGTSFALTSDPFEGKLRWTVQTR